jgi:hypothetical protein
VTLFEGNIKSASIGGRTFEVFDVVIGEAEAAISEAALPQRFTDLPGSSEAAALAMRSERAPFTFTLTLEPIGVRGWRMLTTGRPRPPRAVTKRLNRERRILRRLLVHDAGQSPRAWEWGIGDATERALLGLANGRPVSVPRSLRPQLGRHAGGGR